MKIVIVGHAPNPNQGSEPGFAWDWAWYMSSLHEVWLVAYPEFRAEVEAFLASHPNERLHVVWTSGPYFFEARGGTKNQNVIRLRYLLWLREAYGVVTRLVRHHGIDLVHHVSLTTLSAPPPFWRLPVPFFWGPVGGGQTTPPAFRRYYGKEWYRERLRAERIRLVGMSPALRRAARGAALVFVTNHETGLMLRRAGANADHVRLLADGGTRPENLRAEAKARFGTAGLTVVWAGRLEPRKGLPILLEALARVRDCRPTLLVAGAGRMLPELRDCTARLGVERHVEFLGLLPPEGMIGLFDRADVFVFTSLQDSLGTVVLEAMARGVPLITLDHQGASAHVPDGAGIRIPVRDPEETVASLAATVRRLTNAEDELRALSAASLEAAQAHSWPKRAASMNALYEAYAGPDVGRSEARERPFPAVA